MGRLAKKTTILFDSDEYERLKGIARRRKCSVGELVRSALRKEHMLSAPAKRVSAARKLAALSLPVSECEEMEQQSILGGIE